MLTLAEKFIIANIQSFPGDCELLSKESGFIDFYTTDSENRSYLKNDEYYFLMYDGDMGNESNYNRHMKFLKAKIPHITKLIANERKIIYQLKRSDIKTFIYFGIIPTGNEAKIKAMKFWKCGDREINDYVLNKYKVVDLHPKCKIIPPYDEDINDKWFASTKQKTQGGLTVPFGS